jgi:hypothetical protein
MQNATGLALEQREATVAWPGYARFQRACSKRTKLPIPTSPLLSLVPWKRAYPEGQVSYAEGP